LNRSACGLRSIDLEIAFGRVCSLLLLLLLTSSIQQQQPEAKPPHHSSHRPSTNTQHTHSTQTNQIQNTHTLGRSSGAAEGEETDRSGAADTPKATGGVYRSPSSIRGQHHQPTHSTDASVGGQQGLWRLRAAAAAGGPPTSAATLPPPAAAAPAPDAVGRGAAAGNSRISSSSIGTTIRTITSSSIT
jgi:hypothetical protein